MTKWTVMRRASFLFALLFHLFLLLSFTVVFTFQPVREETPGLIIPSYTQQEVDKTVVNKQQMQQMAESRSEKSLPEKDDQDGLKKKPRPAKASQANRANKSEEATVTKAMDGIHLVGKKKLDDPLIKILGQAIGRTLIYPRIALDFNLRGTAYVGFNIRPDGIITDVKLVQSSNAGVLDEEAVRAIRVMSPVRNVGEYVKETKYLVVGIIFG